MVVAKPIRDLLTVNPKAEMTDAVMTLLDQVAKLSERNSQLSEQSSQFSAENFTSLNRTPSFPNSSPWSLSKTLDSRKKILLLCSVFQILSEAWA